jgi:hypothetical protein
VTNDRPTTDEHRYRIVLDPAATVGSPGHRLEVGRDTSVGAVAFALQIVFDTQERIDGVELVVGGAPVGTAGRGRVRSLVDAAGPVRGDVPLGSADGATLPGPPTRFVVVTFRCVECGETVYRIAADEPVPSCRTPPHGRMERVG